MKLIIAVIQPTKFAAVRDALDRVGVTRMTVCDAHGYARQRGHDEVYRGYHVNTNLLRKIELVIMVNDDFVERTVATIEEVARTGPEGNIGDGKVFVLPAVETYQISEDTHGPGAV
ncbi:MAG: P-II family nitrogen regulator [Pirellulales bacterium]|nr:P-II family nitrogen regulator [Planctomycetales bacterium]